MEKSCMAAGAKNCAVFARFDSVERMRENRSLMAGGRLWSRGAIQGGRIKEAKIVMPSRAAKRA